MTADKLFENGIALLRHNPLSALSHFEKAYAIKKTPTVQSYMGMCIAIERGKISYGLALCNDAITQEPKNPVHYLNLGKIFLKTGRKTDAVEIFRKGLSFGDDVEIKAVLEVLGTRKKPALPFLQRDNPINKYIGMLLNRFRLQ